MVELLSHPDFNESVLPAACAIAEHIVEVFERGGRLFFAGNGGSAAEAQHMAAEYVNMLARDRAPLGAFALTADSSVVTSISNDRDFGTIFARQLEALGTAADFFIGYTTSGKSVNIHNAVIASDKIGMKSAVFTGAQGSSTLPEADFRIVIPSVSTQRIQESHLLLGHSIAKWVENKIFFDG